MLAQPLDHEQAILGEGPIWVAAEQKLYWVDIKGHRLHSYHPARKDIQRWDFNDNLAWVLPRRGGGLVAGTKREIGLLDVKGKLVFTPRVKIEADQPANRLNDAKVDKDGTILFGTMDDHEASATGAFYRLFPDFTVKQLDTGYVIANGPAVAPGTGTIYHTDSALRRIYKFDSKGGEISNKNIFIQFNTEDGYPDGMTVDCEGGLWVAHWGGGRVSRFLPNGKLDNTISVPASQVTSCCFGGPNLNELFITTAAINLTSSQLEQEPCAGCLLSVKVAVKGVDSPTFAG